MTRLAPNISLDTFNGIVDKLYDAAADPSRWPAVTTAVMQAFRSESAILGAADTAARQIVKFDVFGSFANYADEYGPYLQVDPRTPFFMSPRPNQILFDYLWTTEDDLRRSESYSWMTRRFDAKYTMGVCTYFPNQTNASLMVGRSSRQGHAQASEIDALRLILPHFARALSINASFRHVTAIDVFDALATGIVLVDSLGATAYANRAARAMSDANDGIALSAAGMSCRKSSDRQTLHKLIAAAMPNSGSVTRGGRMAISRPSGRAPYIVAIAPWHGTHDGFFAPATVITITDPAPDLAGAPAILNQTFGLSKAEARLASALADGLTLDETSQRLGVSINTVRTQLRQIFAKTDTRRQSQLVKLLSAALSVQPH